VEIDSDKCIIVYLDVLGYSSWVKKAESEKMVFYVFKELIFRHELFKDQSEEFLSSLKTALSLYIVSDSIIIAIDLNKCQSEEVASASVFLQYVALFICEFISKTGLLIRGGLGYGDLMIKNIEETGNCKFIFGKTYVDIAALEKCAVYPKILVHESFANYFTKNFCQSSLEHGFLQKQWEWWSFDYYHKLGSFLHVFLSGKLLKSIKVQIENMFYANAEKKEVREKYYYFRDYHNDWVRKIFKPSVLDEDIKSLGMSKEHVLKSLEQLGILESSADFFIVEDLNLNICKLIQRITHVFKDKSNEVASIIINRVNENMRKREDHYINLNKAL
jgi:hypothetical protein